LASAQEHYERFLAQHYTWMGGGLEQKVAENRQFFATAKLVPRLGGKALDLGCGSGYQTLALAELGFTVTAVDSSEALLTELRGYAADKPVTAIVGDIRDQASYERHGPFELAVCMGDTLLHLPSLEDVAQCLTAARQSLEPGGVLVLGFRDLTAELKGIERMIPVRLDDERLMATFLEYEPEHVVVHDMLFERDAGKWAMQKSAYRKLRLAPSRLTELLGRLDFRDIRQSTERGFSITISWT
jgi:SAM-dependent methyltransferase